MKNSEGFIFGTVGIPKSTPKNPGGTLGGINRIHELSLSALELGWVRSVRVSEEICAQIKSSGVQNCVKLSVHAPYYINLNASAEEWPKSRKRLMDAAYYGFLAGATDVIFHPGSYFNDNPPQVLERAINRLSDCVTELKSMKIDILLRPETMGKKALIGSLEDLLHLSSQIDTVEPCLDFAHLHARTGDGTMNSYNEWIELIDQYRFHLGEKSLQNLHIHISGIEYSVRGEKKHLELAESDFRFVDLLQSLKDKKCGGRILCESPVLEEDAIKLMAIWEKLN